MTSTMQELSLIPELIFWLFAAMAITSAVMVVLSPNPVRGALFLVFTFVNMAALWLMTQAEFLSFILIVVYVGAVMTLFLFVVMMLRLDYQFLRRGVSYYIPVFLFAMFAIVGMLALVIKEPLIDHSGAAFTLKDLGKDLYTVYVYPFEIAGVILLVSIIAAIALAFRGKQDRLGQVPNAQIAVTKKDRLRMVKMQAEKKE